MLNIHDLKAAYEKAIGHETTTARSITSGPTWLAQVDRVPFIPNATSRLKTHLKKRLSKCCEEGPSRRPAWPLLADHVCR